MTFKNLGLTYELKGARLIQHNPCAPLLSRYLTKAKVALIFKQPKAKRLHRRRRYYMINNDLQGVRVMGRYLDDGNASGPWYGAVGANGRLYIGCVSFTVDNTQRIREWALE